MHARKSVLGHLILIVVFLALPFQPARADLVSTEQVVSASRVQTDREKVRAFMNRADAERGLKALGVRPELARQRIDALSDEEVMRIAGKIDTLPAGGNLGQTDIIIILLVAILVVLVI